MVINKKHRCIVLPFSCCLVWDGGLCLSKVTGCSMMRQKSKLTQMETSGPHVDLETTRGCDGDIANFNA